MQLEPITRAERGIIRTLLLLDRPFGRLAPASRLFKLLAVPTVTDIENGQPRVGLVRVERARALFDAASHRWKA